MKKVFIILALAVAASSCAVKDDSLPVVDPNAAGAYISIGAGISTTSKSIKVEYLWVSVYDVKITAYGICCSDTGTPTISNYACSYSYPVSEDIPFVINGLQPSTTYFCRPFFVISSGAVYYGDTVMATTSGAIEMTLTPPSDISQYGGLVTASATDGSFEDCTERGFCYGTSETPTVSDNKVTCPGTNNPMSSFIPMTPGVLYYYRAYAKLADGTYIYSPDVNYIQNYAITVGGDVPSAMSGSFYYEGTYYPYKVDINTYYDYYSVSDLTEIGFEEMTYSWHYTYLIEGEHLDSRTWYFPSATNQINYRAYAILKNGTKVYGEEKVLNISYR